jgi:hypothetical protein
MDYEFDSRLNQLETSLGGVTDVAQAIADAIAQVELLQGPQGIPGVNGADGTNGTNGADGVQGPQGLPGAIGPQGVPGSNGTVCTVGSRNVLVTNLGFDGYCGSGNSSCSAGDFDSNVWISVPTVTCL